MSTRTRSPIRQATGPEGVPTYLIELPPQALPPVRTGELDEAWRVAHDAASGTRWGTPRLLRFVAEDGTLDLALTDDDACCWAEALDHRFNLDTVYGLSMCIRLLALIALIARAPWTQPLTRLTRAGAVLEPALLRICATTPLDGQAGFDEDLVRTQLRHAAPFLAPHESAPGVLY